MTGAYQCGSEGAQAGAGVFPGGGAIAVFPGLAGVADTSGQAGIFFYIGSTDWKGARR